MSTVPRPATMMTAADPKVRAPGRPRDGRIDGAIRSAAQRVFLKYGWSKFTFESIANEAGVGKPAIYRRWESREALLVDCLKPIDAPLVPDLGSFVEELRLLASEFLRWMLDTEGALFFRSLAESMVNSDISHLIDTTSAQVRARANREITIRAIKRGEVKPDTSPSMVAEMVTGAALFHYLYTPPNHRTDIRNRIDMYADQIVKTIMVAVYIDNDE
jgi:AcrR family transcriptional regulator